MIAIVAGTGSLPIEACKSLMQKNEHFFVISLFPENNLKQIEYITQKKIPIFSQNITKAGSILKIVKKQKTTDVLFIGKVDKRNLLKKLSFDWLAIKMFAKMACKSDKTIMEAILDLLKKHNIKIISQNKILGNLFVPPGILTGKLSAKLKKDIEIGMQVAQNISQHDIGQTVVIKDKMILSVEAIEGTDNCIKRGIEIGKENVVVCKSATHKQNKKYDLPTLGPKSLEFLKPGQVKVIAWQSSHTFIAQKEEFTLRAKELGITLISVVENK
jgi:UDP-2,3-diacylglucosamine hydrolase